jgi:hypothetical protein
MERDPDRGHRPVGTDGAYHDAASRDPRRFGFGYLAADPDSGAVAAFVWFATPRELLDFLTTTEVELLQFDDDDSVRIRAALTRVIGGTRDLKRLDRHALSAAVEGWSDILWLGTFADLVGQGGAFQTGIRADFRSAHGLAEHGGPIADDELEAFVGYLATGAQAADDPST